MNNAPDPDPDSLATLAQLEMSLRHSHAALLARDLARLDELTAEQDALQPLLSTLAKTASDVDPASASALRQACLRVWTLGRLQLALLRRAQQSLRIDLNLMAGPQAGYSSLGCSPHHALPRTLSSTEA